MKKVLMIFLVLAVVALIIGITSDDAIAEKSDCATIKDGTIMASTGGLLTTGFDEFGYNYQAHMFRGRYCDYDRVAGGPYCDVELIMKWNDAWISNKDCDGDDLLDRHHGFPGYIGSGAWLTNHQWGSYVDPTNGEVCFWDYFVKIVAVPTDAYEGDIVWKDGIPGGIMLDWNWYRADGTEIGPQIWGAFAAIQRVYNDPCLGDFGIEYLSPVGPGFGHITK